jgi:hypothetical protein
MKSVRTAPLVAIAGCLLVAVALILPYTFETAAGTTVGLYYSSGAVNPLVAGLFALIAVIITAAGREERTDPLLAAGVGLVLGVFVLVIAALWALTVPQDVWVGIAESELGKQHRWGVVAAAVVTPLAELWWARSLGVL